MVNMRLNMMLLPMALEGMTWSSHNEVVSYQGAATTTTIDGVLIMNMRHMEMLIHPIARLLVMM
jgi:hypothetical protein